jgi:disulfide bond formation protein DsbB
MDAALRARLVATAGIATAISLATILGAWGFEIIGGYEPCPLCLNQRIPYYIGVPIMAVAAAVAVLRLPASATRLLLVVGGVVFLVSAGLGIHHAGVEWGFWEGPTSCAGGGGVELEPGQSLADFFAAGGRSGLVSCTEASWRWAGLSFAGWNAVISVAVAVIALRGAAAGLHGRWPARRRLGPSQG